MPQTYAHPESRERASRSAAARPSPAWASNAAGVIDPRPNVARLAQLVTGPRPPVAAADDVVRLAPGEAAKEAPKKEEAKKEEPKTKRSILAPGLVLTPGRGAIAAVSKEASGSGAHAWVATEYLDAGGESKSAVMHLLAEGGYGDSNSGGSGGSGESSGAESKGSGQSAGSDAKSVKGSKGSAQSGAASNAQDSGSIVRLGKSDVGSAEPATFGTKINIKNTADAGDGYLQVMAGKTERSWNITDAQGAAAFTKAEEMKTDADAGKYIYSLTGRAFSFTKTGMNCARFAETVIKAGGVNASAGLVIFTPLELATGKKFYSR